MVDNQASLLVPTPSFTNHGGWVLDSQFELETGSSYLLAHGNGTPVADAITSISIPRSGAYKIYVRTKNWVPGHSPGTFKLAVDGIEFEQVFGVAEHDRWDWEAGAEMELQAGNVEMRLRDVTGFGARCDALYLATGDDVPPSTSSAAEYVAWRRTVLSLPSPPPLLTIQPFDVCVLGGGIPGVAAALTSARLGLRVCIVQNRPFFGGNASVEVGLRPRGITGPLIDDIYDRRPDGDIHARELLDAEKNVQMLLEHTVYDFTMEKRRIKAIDARDAGSGREVRIAAEMFIDCSGRALFGVLADAETLFGEESQEEYGESLAPAKKGAPTHHGNTLFFRTCEADTPVSFPAVPWATEVAKDYSNLSGQLVRPGIENGDGPAVQGPSPSLRRRMKGPMTHFWEYGQYLNPYTQGEHIRDHLLRAIYGIFSNIKTLSPQKYANLKLDWVAFVAATGEFARYKGDHILTETDIRTHAPFPDAVVQNSGAFCLHYPPDRDSPYDFRLKYWGWDERDGKAYDIPFRCLYSRNIENLMMAGKHISVTHVAGSNTKFMGNGGQHAIATAAAAGLCKKYGVLPRELWREHMAELKVLAREISGRGNEEMRSRL